MTTKDIMNKVKDFFTVKNSLIILICILILIIVFQNIRIFGGSKFPRDFDGKRSNTSSQMKFPGMGGGMGSYKRQ